MNSTSRNIGLLHLVLTLRPTMIQQLQTPCASVHSRGYSLAQPATAKALTGYSTSTQEWSKSHEWSPFSPCLAALFQLSTTGANTTPRKTLNTLSFSSTIRNNSIIGTTITCKTMKASLTLIPTTTQKYQPNFLASTWNQSSPTTITWSK